MNQRNFGLDLVRAVAILSVVHGHSYHILKGQIDPSTFQYFRLPIDGVSLFFALSGYLIGGILIRTLEKNGGVFGFRDVLYFWQRRWMRTLPNYFFVLTVAILVIEPKLKLVEYVKFYTFTHNILDAKFRFFLESWSLSVEEWFYISLPILTFLVLKATRNHRVSFLAAALVLVLFPMLFRLYQGDAIAADSRLEYGAFFRKAVLTRLDGIAYGVLMAYVMQYYAASWNRYRFHVIACALFVWGVVSTTGPRSMDGLYREVFFFSLQGAVLALILPLAADLKRPPRIFDRTITYISKISYSMYLIHLTLILGLLKRHYLDVHDLGNVVASLAMYWAAVFFFSTILHYTVEKPFMDMRK